MDKGFGEINKVNLLPEKQQFLFWFMYLDFKTDLNNIL